VARIVLRFIPLLLIIILYGLLVQVTKEQYISFLLIKKEKKRKKTKKKNGSGGETTPSSESPPPTTTSTSGEKEENKDKDNPKKKDKKNPKSSFSFVKGILPKYFSSEWSFAQFRVPDVRSMVAFGAEKNSIIVVSADGTFYKALFDPEKPGVECVQETFAKFIKTAEDET